MFDIDDDFVFTKQRHWGNLIEVIFDQSGESHVFYTVQKPKRRERETWAFLEQKMCRYYKTCHFIPNDKNFKLV